MPREAGEDSGAQPRARRDAPGGFGRGPRISLLAIFWHQYCKLVRGPFRTVKAAVLGACAAVLLILGAALIVPGLTQVALLSAAASLVLLLTLVVLLISRLIARLTDVQALFSLECGLARSGYVLDDFYTDGAAANPSLQLLLLKCLRFSRPQRILELGSGQTTKLLTCYQKANPDSHVITLEQDADWARRMRALIPQEAQGHDYRYRPLEKRVFLDPRSCRPIHSLWYRDVADLRARRFGLILVDGPDHGAKGTEFTPYSRSGILEYIPGILDDSWILVFDDAERYGEIMTTRLCEAILSKHKRPFLRFEVHGEKSQTIFCSPSLGFLATS
ncbi:MAG TPA: hypothetical protein VK395_06985 [Gemmataceae bacterium]|nr:hypothetical protein [Gemmataceae bacterium]